MIKIPGLAEKSLKNSKIPGLEKNGQKFFN